MFLRNARGRCSSNVILMGDHVSETEIEIYEIMVLGHGRQLGKRVSSLKCSTCHAIRSGTLYAICISLTISKCSYFRKEKPFYPNGVTEVRLVLYIFLKCLL